MKPTHLVLLTALAAMCLAHGCWRVAVWYGVLPCNHACYWCGKSLESK